MASQTARARLSKGILEMKFMQRTKARFDKELEDAEGRAMYANEITDKMKNQVSNFIMEPSFMRCEGLPDGRYSYRGMNPRLERVLELEQAEKEEQNRPQQPTEVSDQEMKAFYEKSRLAKTMSRKFETKRKHAGNDRSEKKAKFRKPNDD